MDWLDMDKVDYPPDSYGYKLAELIEKVKALSDTEPDKKRMLDEIAASRARNHATQEAAIRRWFAS